MVDENPEIRVKVSEPDPQVKTPDSLKRQREGSDSHVLRHLEKTLLQTADRTLFGDDQLSRIVFPNDSAAGGTPTGSAPRNEGSPTSIAGSALSGLISQPIKSVSPEKMNTESARTGDRKITGSFARID